jgi:subtilisin family serine protease
MRRIVLSASSLTFILLISLISSTALSGYWATTNQSKSYLSTNGWWDHWVRDKDHNGIDDVLDNMIDSNPGTVRTKIFIDYSRPPTDEDISILSTFNLKIAYIYNIVDTICARNVLLSDIDKISNLNGVVMVEYEDDISGLLDISARAVKARNSIEYVGNNVHDLGILGRDISIAILDTGVDDDLTRTQIQHHDSVDDLDDDPETDDPKFLAGVEIRPSMILNINPDDKMSPGHGTHVAGIAMGTGAPGDSNDDDEYDYIGIAPQARLIDVKVLEDWRSGSGGELLGGIEWCVEHKDEYGIRILSMSLGGSYNSDGSDAISQAVNEAVDAGLIVVVAIGNDGTNMVPPPAAADKAIVVGAINDMGTVIRSDDQIWPYSNRGPRQDDGDDDLTDELKPDVVAPGVNIMSARCNTNGAFISYSGTSMACPHVSGIIALMLEVNPNLTPEMVKEILRLTAEMPAGVDPYNPDIDPIYNVRWGWGIVDAYGAIKMVQQYDPRPPIISDPQEYVSGVTATITWRTHKEANSTILYGKSQDQLDQVESDPDNYTLEHSISLTDLEEDTKYYYKILGYDEMGNGPGQSDIRWFQTEILPDTTPPEITNVRVVAKSDRTATIFWDTNELADGSVEYGLTAEYGDVRSDFKLMWRHSITLFDLEPSTMYHYRVNSTDGSDNNNHSDDLTFTTEASPDEMAPFISGIKVIDITDNSAAFVWESNEPSNAVIRYNEKYNEDPKYWKKVTAIDYYWEDFSIKITGLIPSTVYYYQIESRDPSDNSRTYGDSSTKFNTTGPPDNTAPSILDGYPRVSILTDTTATIEWITDEESEGAVEYGLTTGYGSIEPKEPSGDYVFVHNITLTGLTPSTPYHFRVISKDNSPNANEYISNDHTFTTRPEPDLKPPKILEGPTRVVGETTATIFWATDELSDSVVYYGIDPNYGSEASDSSFVKSHEITLIGLIPSTTYHYKFKSTDSADNSYESEDHVFTTLEIVMPIEIEFLNLQNGQTLSGVYRIEGSVSGGIGNIDLVQYKIDNESWQNLGKGNTFSIVLDTSKYSEGEHTLNVRVEVGDMTMQEDITFFAEHQTDDEEGIWTWVIFLVIMVVLTLAVVLAISRSTGRKRAATRESGVMLTSPTSPEAPYPMDAFSPADTEKLRFFADEPALAFQETEAGISLITETTTLSEEPEVSFIPDREPVSFNISEEEPIFSVFDTVRCPRCKNMFNADISSRIQCPECGFSASLKK